MKYEKSEADSDKSTGAVAIQRCVFLCAITSNDLSHPPIDSLCTIHCNHDDQKPEHVQKDVGKLGVIPFGHAKSLSWQAEAVTKCGSNTATKIHAHFRYSFC